MLDSRASNNIMTLEVMNQLGLQITRPYRNVRAMDAREVACLGITKDLQFCLLACPQKCMVMDVVTIDYPTQWGMLLSRKWCADVGGTLQMDLTYVDIHVEDNFKIRVFREQKMLHNVEDPRIGDNDPMYPGIKEPEVEEGDLGSYMLTDDVDPPIPVVPEYEPHQVWLMQFDGSNSYIASSAGILFTSPNGMVYPFSYRLEFPCTNNMVEYEALLLGLKKARKMGLKCLRVEGYFELIVKQVRKECEAIHPCMKRYKNVVWDEIELFDAFNITHIGREINKDADSLARTTTLFQPYITNPYIQHLVEVSFHPHVPDNIIAMQVFEDDEQILNFMRCEK